VGPGQWDPRPLLEQIEREVPGASSNEAIFGLLHRLDGLDGPNPRRANWADPEDEGGKSHEHWMGRWCAAQETLKAKLAGLPGTMHPAAMADALAFVIEDQHRNPGCYSSDDASFAIARRVERDLRSIGDDLREIAGVAAGAASFPQQEVHGRDAELIRAVGAIDAARDAYNQDHGDGGTDNNPLWQAYEKLRDIISEASPQTVEGLFAKARAAKSEARVLVNGTYYEQPSNTPAETWAWDLVNDLVRLFGAGAPRQAQSCPVAALIPDLARAENDYGAADYVVGADAMERKVRDHLASMASRRMDALWAMVETLRPSSPHGAMACVLGAIRHLDDLDASSYSEEEVGRKAEAARNLLAGAYYVFQGVHGEAGLQPVRDAHIGLYRYSLATREEYEAAQRKIEAGL
jgi:hypothetical protein